MIALEKASARPVRLMAATIRPDAASALATITPDGMAPVSVVKIRRGRLGSSPADHDTTTGVNSAQRLPVETADGRGVLEGAADPWAVANNPHERDREAPGAGVAGG